MNIEIKKNDNFSHIVESYIVLITPSNESLQMLVILLNEKLNML